nr:hypothetical protein Iba_chr14bCG6080 [Ipomoea batatas]GME01041.1 hypothetical protein Iba_scaffold1676451CG0020 [Ipomoea batatas]
MFGKKPLLATLNLLYTKICSTVSFSHFPLQLLNLLTTLRITLLHSGQIFSTAIGTAVPPANLLPTAMETAASSRQSRSPASPSLMHYSEGKKRRKRGAKIQEKNSWEKNEGKTTFTLVALDFH